MSQNNLVGNVLGDRYRIDDLIGQGGMSAVYKAYDPNLKRVVAIKVIHPHLADDPKFVLRFEDEAAAVAQLHHPNIVQVHDFNNDQDLYYMVQEFVPGETLQELLRRLSKADERLPLEEAIGYTRDICDASGFAHKRGMIHRDIKPANIILNMDGKAILMDFGIVKITGGAVHTATGAVVGTALYMSPELIKGEVPDQRADIYSLGVTLFEMVSGRPPFEADSAMSLMMMHMRDPLPNMHHLRPEVPEDMIAVLNKALAKSPDDRYASMSEFAGALSAVLEHLQSGVVAQEHDPAGVAAAATLVESPGPAAIDDEEDTFPDGKAAAGAAAVGLASASTAPESASPVVQPPVSSAVEGSDPPSSEPVPAITDSGPVDGKKIRPAIWIGAAVVILILIVGGIGIGLSLSGNDGNGDTEQVVESEPTVLAVADVIEETAPTETPTASPDATVIAELALALTPSVTPSPTLFPTPTISPTPTFPPGIPFVRINGISMDDNLNYVVDYETSEFTEKLPGTHIHFFFDTVPPENAGVPQSGPWILYGGPRPFSGYSQNQRPEHAMQMCTLVANPDHSVQPESGTCYDLPDVVVATSFRDTTCYSGPDPAYGAILPLVNGQRLIVVGISPDEKWWYVTDPKNPAESCWLAQEVSIIGGDISSLGLIDPPPLPEGISAANPSVNIQQITIDEGGSYVVEYVIQGFTEQLPGTHLHFFFNTELPENVGMSGGGNRLMYGGPSPFTSYNTGDRPPEATEMCVLVTNPDHSVILESGNCSPLP